MAYLLEPEPRGKVELSEIPMTFARLVGLTLQPVEEETLRQEAGARGIDLSDLDELVEQLVMEKVLRRVDLGPARS